MKKIFKLLAAGCLLLAVVSLSSCLGDSDNSSDQEKEWKEWYEALLAEIAAAQGHYAGFVYYQPDVTSAKLDSVAAEWDIVSDSVIELRGVPTRLFVEKMADNEVNTPLKEAISAVGTVNMQIKIIYDVYYKSPLLFYLYPEPVTLNVNVEGQDKTVDVNFHSTYTDSRSYGQTLVSNGECLLKMYPKSIVVDKSAVQYFNSSDYAYLYWYGKKR